MEFINRVIHALTEVHPTHPMIVHFPIALSGAAFLFIVLAAWRMRRTLFIVHFLSVNCPWIVVTASAVHHQQIATHPCRMLCGVAARLTALKCSLQV